MRKDRQPDWQDTNVALIGSDIDRKCKEAAAHGEPQWRGAGTSVGLQLWRIEQFRVVPWPQKKWGKFHRGDSYIVLRTYKKPNNNKKLEWDVHFWIGSESSQDEYGTAAYKTVELDDFLGGGATQHRQVEGAEAQDFLDLFGGRVQYLEGGVATGFKKTELKERQARLFEVKGGRGNLRLRQVKLSRSSMNSGDVYILDTEFKVFVWVGSESNAAERGKADELAKGMAAERGGGTQVVHVPDGEPDEEDPFWKELPGERRFLGIKVGRVSVKGQEAGGEDAAVKAHQPLLLRLKAGERGAFSYSRAGTGAKLPVSRLKSGDVFLYDNGFEIFLWVGKGADQQEPDLPTSPHISPYLPTSPHISPYLGLFHDRLKLLAITDPTPTPHRRERSAPSPYLPISPHTSPQERVSAFPFAQRYLKDYRRPSVLPITRYAEGKEAPRFIEQFGPPAKGCFADPGQYVAHCVCM